MLTRGLIRSRLSRIFVSQSGKYSSHDKNCNCEGAENAEKPPGGCSLDPLHLPLFKVQLRNDPRAATESSLKMPVWSKRVVFPSGIPTGFSLTMW
jgi:hypothetical protein